MKYYRIQATIWLERISACVKETKDKGEKWIQKDMKLQASTKSILPIASDAGGTSCGNG